MDFSAGYAKVFLMVYQGDIVAGSNGWMIIRIYSSAGREKRSFIFETSYISEKAFRIFYEFKTFREQL
jgi:hypothetical protein